MEDFRAIGKRLSNWGRWGKEDERGATNLIGPDQVKAAAALVRKGAIFDLGIPFGADGPQPGGGRINPVLLVSETGADQAFPGPFHYADDYIFMPLQAATQWDSLAHVFYDDLLYNGWPASDVTAKGAKHNSIDKQAKGIAGRGVLLDIAGMLGAEWLEQGFVITPDHLDQACKDQGVSVGTGDILLFRTGWRKKFVVEKDPAAFMAGDPGLGIASLDWLAQHEVSAVTSDNWAIEVLPGENDEVIFGFHMVAIRDMGLSLGEMLDFEELVADCRADGVWEFLFTAPPIKFSKAVGSPINPLAIK
jgi:kynurenine formamidase